MIARLPPSSIILLSHSKGQCSFVTMLMSCVFVHCRQLVEYENCSILSMVQDINLSRIAMPTSTPHAEVRWVTTRRFSCLSWSLRLPTSQVSSQSLRDVQCVAKGGTTMSKSVPMSSCMDSAEIREQFGAKHLQPSGLRGGEAKEQSPLDHEYDAEGSAKAGGDSEDTTMTSFIDSIPISELRRSRFDEPDEYEEIRRLGNGGNGNCFLLQSKSDNALRVCKVSPSHPSNSKNHCIEKNLLNDILPPHDRIVMLYHSTLLPWKTQLYFEYCSGGDLSTMITNFESIQCLFEESFVWHCYEQLCEALAFIHAGYDAQKDLWLPYRRGGPWQPIIHGDIKPGNIFLKPSPNKGHHSLVLGDFGSAQRQPGVGYIGTLAYQPPELPAYSLKSDIWSVGAVIHSICHLGRPPICDPAKKLPYTSGCLSLWAKFPQARHKWPINSTVYSETLDWHIGRALCWDPENRLDAYNMLQQVKVGVSQFTKMQRHVPLESHFLPTDTIAANNADNNPTTTEMADRLVRFADEAQGESDMDTESDVEDATMGTQNLFLSSP